MTSSNDPLEALEAVRSTDQKMAKRMRWPLWRHAAFGLVLAALTISPAIPMPYTAVMIVLPLAGIVAIMESDRRNHGTLVSGWSSIGARPATIIAALISLLGFVASILVRGLPNGWTLLAAPIALTVCVGVTVCSLWWERLYRRELANEGNAQ